jgi:hypothetical protein
MASFRENSSWAKREPPTHRRMIAKTTIFFRTFLSSSRVVAFSKWHILKKTHVVAVYLAETVPSFLINPRFFRPGGKNSGFFGVLAEKQGRRGKRPEGAWGIRFL